MTLLLPSTNFEKNMPFLIETWDKPNHQHVRQEAQDKHIAFLKANQIRLLACGAKLSDDGKSASGGLYIVDSQTREEAEQFIATDPFSRAGLFAEIRITRWRKAFLDAKCFL